MNAYVYKFRGETIIVKELREDLARPFVLAHLAENDFDNVEEELTCVDQYDIRDREIIYSTMGNS